MFALPLVEVLLLCGVRDARGLGRQLLPGRFAASGLAGSPLEHGEDEARGGRAGGDALMRELMQQGTYNEDLNWGLTNFDSFPSALELILILR